MATFISALLAERVWWFFLSCRRTPLNERLIGSMPSELGVGCLGGRTLNTPLTFSHWSPPQTNLLLCLSEKDIVPRVLSAYEQERSGTVSSGSGRICHL